MPPDDDAGLAAGLARLINDEELRNMTAGGGRQFIEQHYSKERLLEDIAVLYRQLVQRGSAGVTAKSPESGLESRAWRSGS